MSREFDIKDILTEAASRDFSEIINTPWTPSDSHEKFINKLIRKTDKHGFVSPGLLKGLTAAAVILLLFGICMAIRPIREPAAAFFGNMFGASVGADTEKTTDTELQGTDAVTEKSGIVTEETTNMSEQTETEYVPKTDEDWVDVLVEAIANGDNSSLRWEALHSFGQTAFDHLVKRYFDGEKNDKIKAVISVFTAEELKDEISACEFFSNTRIPRRSELESSTDVYSVWLLDFKSNAQVYVNKTVKEDALKEAPLICRLISLVGHESYKFDPGRESVEECLNRLIIEYTDEVINNLTKDRKNETIEYCAKNYFTETDKTRRAYMSWLVFKSIGRWEMMDLVGYDLVSTFFEYGDSYILPDGSDGANGVKYHPDIVEPIIQKYAGAAMQKAKTLYRQETKDFFPGTYVFLTAMDFDGYKPEPFDIAYRTRPLLEELNTLYRAVTYGLSDHDNTSQYYWISESSHENINTSAYPGGLKEKIEKLWNKHYPIVATQKQGMKTIDEWYEHYSGFLPEDIVYGFIKESACFIVNDGIVYTLDDGGVGDFTTWILSRTAHIIEEKDGYTVIGFDVQKGGHMEYETTEFTVNVVEENGTLRITGGTYIDRYLKNDIKTVAADALHSILLMHSVWYNGNITQPPFSATEYNSIDDIPVDLRNHYKSDIFPSYSCWAHDAIHWDDYLDKNNVTAVFENAKAVYTFFINSGRYLFVIPSLVKYTDIPAFCTENELSVRNIYNNLKVISKNKDNLSCSLDFIREENKESKNVTYTFEFEYTEQSGYIQLTGGTFLNEVLIGK